MLEGDRWHAGQLGAQLEGELTVLLKQLATFGDVGAVLDDRIVLELILLGALLARIRSVGKVVAAAHQAADVVDRLRFACVLVLERVHLDVIDCARLQFVGVALVRSVMAREDGVCALGGVLPIKQKIH